MMGPQVFLSQFLREAIFLLPADGGYAAANSSNNGHRGDLIYINGLGNVTTQVTLKFVDSLTDDPVETSRLYFTLSDVDAPKDGFERAVVNNTFSKVFITADSSVKVQNLGDSTTFESTKYGDAQENPAERVALTAQQEAAALSLFTFVFRRQDVRTPVSYTNHKAWYGRNFLITCVVDIACPGLFGA